MQRLLWVIAVSALAITLLVPCASYAQFGGLSVPSIPKGPETVQLSVKDIVDNSQFDYQPAEFEGVEYIQIGEPAFDEFFKSAAKIDGVCKLSVSLTDNATKNLKKFARSKAADESLKADIEALVGKTPPEQWTTEQDFAVMQTAKKRGKLSEEELEYFAGTAVSLGIAVAGVQKGVEAAGSLVSQGSSLASKASSLDMSQKVAATSGVSSAVGNLQSFIETSPQMVKSLSTLVTGFSSL